MMQTPFPVPAVTRLSCHSGMASSSSTLMPSNPLPTNELSNPVPKATCTTRNGQCTHITITRFYTRDFRCAICLQPGSMGWLYRCTQDRELLIEDDLERDHAAAFDQLVTMLPPSMSPKKRSAAARTSSSLAFLEEISQEDLKSYSPVQISTILKQRTQLLDVAKESESNAMMPTTEGLCLDVISEIQFLPFSNLSASPEMLGSPRKKSWLPVQECQFKCCQRCRPSFHERSYLSLDAVANGELPATALTGFGFHYQKERPVALVEYVRNLGLRPNPVVRKKLYRGRPPRVSSLTTPSPSRQDHFASESTTSSSPFNDEPNADTTFGQISNAYDSTAMARSLNIESSHFSCGGVSSYGAAVRKAFTEVMLMRQQEPQFTGINKFEIGKSSDRTTARSPWTVPKSLEFETESTLEEGTILDSDTTRFNGRITQSLRTDHALGSHFNLDELHEDGDLGLFLSFDDALFKRACDIVLPVETADEQIILSMPMRRSPDASLPIEDCSEVTP